MTTPPLPSQCHSWIFLAKRGSHDSQCSLLNIHYSNADFNLKHLLPPQNKMFWTHLPVEEPIFLQCSDSLTEDSCTECRIVSGSNPAPPSPPMVLLRILQTSMTTLSSSILLVQFILILSILGILYDNSYTLNANNSLIVFVRSI